jgi:protein-tyrosine phosphatase
VGVSYVDLHLHLLPGVDDGARDVEDSLRHAAKLAREGTHEALVTPHVAHPFYDVEVGSLPQRTAELQRAIARAGIGLRLHSGGELHPQRAAQLSPRELDLVAQGPPGSRWVLLEVPFDGIDRPFLESAAIIRRRGFGLVIAHPERAAGLLWDGMPLLRKLVSSGAVLQVNVCSLLGRNGAEAQEAAGLLLRKRLAYLLASDGHPNGREQTLRQGFELARKLGVSAVQAWQLTQANPRFLLEHGLPDLRAADDDPSWRARSRRQVVAVRRSVPPG